ncbi:MAG TPA: hypothetical protein VHV27_05915 [Phenylobacterium sp.]|nr:hypothetical protein [Phenylobacterium sp.]
MNPVIDRLKLIFLGVFLVVNVALLVWEFGWELPREHCEKAHKWWDGSQRVCAQPILISDITGRVLDNPQARAEALKALGRTAPAPKPDAAAGKAAKPGKTTAPQAAKAH